MDPQQPSQFGEATLPWNKIPVGIDTALLPIPIAVNYSPFAALDNLPVLFKRPVECKFCKAVRNPYSPIDQQRSTWKCFNCFQDNVDHNINPHQPLPEELQIEYSTVEYVLTNPAAMQNTAALHGLETSSLPQQYNNNNNPTNNIIERLPTFVFVVDVAIEKPELDVLTKTLNHQIANLPAGVTIALITFGRNIEIHHLGNGVNMTPGILNNNNNNNNNQSTTTTVNNNNNINSITKSYCIRGDIEDENIFHERVDYAIKRAHVHQLVVPIEHCADKITKTLEKLQLDYWQYDEIQERPQRCTGSALYTAFLLLTHYAQIFPKNAKDPGLLSRVLLFAGGISTTGLGKSASQYRGDHIRSHNALLKEPHVKERFNNAQHFYAKLAHHSLHGLNSKYNGTPGSPTVSSSSVAAVPVDTTSGALSIHNSQIPKISYDIFACCLDQVGLMELAPLIEQTNGQLVLDDSFSRGVFAGSIKSYFTTMTDHLSDMLYDDTSQQQQNQQQQQQRELFNFGFNATLEISASQHTTICYTIGHLIALPAQTQGVKNLSDLSTYNKVYNNSGFVADTYRNITKTIPMTNRYFMNTITPSTTISSIFHPTLNINPLQLQFDKAYGPRVIFQFRTTYCDSLGRTILRVSTFARDYINFLNVKTNLQQYTAALEDLRAGFDQYAALTVLTKLALIHIRTTYPPDVLRWFDGILLDFGKRYTTFHQGNPQSCVFKEEMRLLPELIYNLRRSHLFDIFNSSPDETAFFRLTTLSQNTKNTILIIQPELIAYDIAAPSIKETYMTLDPSALDTKRILLLDTFFHIVIWYGSVVDNWRKSELHKQDGYGYLNELFQAPLKETKRRFEYRYPAPRFIQCVERGSQARFLLVKLNPAAIAKTGGDDPYSAYGNAYGQPNSGDFGSNNTSGANNQQQQENEIFSEGQTIQDYIQQFKCLVVGAKVAKK